MKMYNRPLTEVVKMENQTMLCGSGDPNFGGVSLQNVTWTTTVNQRSGVSQIWI